MGKPVRHNFSKRIYFEVKGNVDIMESSNDQKLKLELIVMPSGKLHVSIISI